MRNERLDVQPDDDLRLIKRIAVIGGALWIGLGAPLFVTLTIGAAKFYIDYHEYAAASAEWRGNVIARIDRIEKRLDSLNNP